MAEEEIGDQNAGGTGDRTSWLSVLSKPLTRVQTLVGITAGILSVAGTLFPLVGFSTFPTHGEFVGVVHDARSRQPIVNATVEILTAQNAIVTTLLSMGDGRVHQSLKEGQYEVRVRYPRFIPEVRKVLITPGQTAEVHLALSPRPAPPPPAQPVEKPGPVKRFFGNLGL